MSAISRIWYLFLYYFHGFTNQSLTTSSTRFEAPATVTLEIQNVYDTVDCFGLTATIDLQGFIVNAEAVLTVEAPVYVNEEIELPIGTVTNTALDSAPLLQWSAGFEWEVFRNVRLLFEYTGVHILEELSKVEESLLVGDSVFGVIDIRLPIGLMEPSLTAGALYDWTGHDFTAIATLGLDFLDGVTVEISGIYFDVFDVTDSTSPIYELLENDLILTFDATYHF